MRIAIVDVRWRRWTQKWVASYIGLKPEIDHRFLPLILTSLVPTLSPYFESKITNGAKNRIYENNSKTQNFKSWNSAIRVCVGITVDAPVTAVWNETNDIQYFKDI